MFDFGFIGAGNMGSALAKGICKKVGGGKVIICDRDSKKAETVASGIGCKAGTSEDVIMNSRYIFLAVKPQVIEAVFSEINEILKNRSERYIFVTMLAGTAISKIESLAGECPVIRIMPNVACAVDEGMVLASKNAEVTDDEFDFFVDALSGSGCVDKVEEKFIDSYSIVSGCGPAYVYMMIEALANGAVEIGVPADKAYLYAAKTLEGSAKLMLETGRTPAALKDSVCSPGGTTIEGVKALEKGAFRYDVMEAVRASYNRTLELNK